MGKRKRPVDMPENTTSSPSYLVLDPKGGAKLRVGTDSATTIELLVSCGILSVASPVFQAMFNNGFVEGQGPSAESPREILFPDDDPESMTMICKIFHLKTSDMPDEMTIDKLAKFALCCDKYACAGGVRAWSRIWLSQYSPKDPGFPTLLAVAYLLDVPKEFAQISRTLLLNYLTVTQSELAIDGHDFLPAKLVENINEDLCRFQKKAMSAIMPRNLRKLFRHIEEDCCKPEPVITSIFHSLECTGLIPIKPMSVQTYFDLAKVSHRKIFINSQCRFTYTTCRNAHKRAGESVLRKMQNVHDSVNGYCLDCVKNITSVEKTRPCRIPHEKLASHVLSNQSIAWVSDSDLTTDSE